MMRAASVACGWLACLAISTLARAQEGQLPAAPDAEPASGASPAEAAIPEAAEATSPEAPPATAATGAGANANAKPATESAPAAAAEADSDAFESLPEHAGAEDEFLADPGSSGVMVGEETPRLELYGFADFSYFHVMGRKDNLLRQYVAAYPSFYVGHLNLYLSSNLGDSWRSLAEVRFTYSPLGDENAPAPDGTFPIPDGTATDYAELQREFRWGGIEIQRAWVEYQPLDFLSIRGGQWFTPYGYWNDDHGSPTIIGVHKPFPIGDQLFPEKQTGLMLHGKYYLGPTALGYAVTLSNGRGPFDAIRDLDNNKALGGRLFLETSKLGDLTVGVEVYRGRFTSSTKRYRVDESGEKPVVEIYRDIDNSYEELSYGADLRWLWEGLHLQAELMANEAAYDEEHRPAIQGFEPRPSFRADYRRVGGYALLGYRTPWWGVMPYAEAEYSSYTDSESAPPVHGWTVGVNLRPTPNVVLKAEGSLALFHGTGSTGLGRDDLSYFGAQAAWAF